MKEMKHAFMALGIMILAAVLAASFFAACGGEEEKDDDDTPEDVFPYTLTLREGSAQGSVLVNATRSQGAAITINRALSNPDGSSLPLTGVSWRFECLTHASDTSACGVTANNQMTSITVAAAAAAGEHACTATAIQSGEPVARAKFTVTVTLSPYGITFNPTTIPVKHDDDDGDTAIGVTLSAPNGDTTGLTLDFACTTHTNPVCGLNFNTNAQGRYVIGKAASTVAVGDHAITATMNGTPPGTPSVTASLTVRVRVKYTFTLTGDTNNVFTVQRGTEFNLADHYTLTKSDGTALENDIKVGVSCKSDYDDCDAILLGDPSTGGRDWADLLLKIPANAGGKAHTVMMQALADDGYGDELASKQFTITVTQ